MSAVHCMWVNTKKTYDDDDDDDDDNDDDNDCDH